MSRVQLALNVADLEASVGFYSTVFGVEPHKRRPGYANFIVEQPPLKLVLIEVPADQRGAGAAGALNHLGVEVDSVAEVHAASGRLVDAGLATFEETDTTCCYALQDKVWVSDPAGAPWEFYTVKDDDPANPEPASASLPLLESTGGCCSSASSVATSVGESATGGCCSPAASSAASDSDSAPAPFGESAAGVCCASPASAP